MKITWDIHTFEELTTSTLYLILKLRQEVFVVEQNCAYLDCDDRDQSAYHLLGVTPTKGQTELAAYLRIIPPTSQSGCPHIGRVLCQQTLRGTSIGKQLMQEGIHHCRQLFPEKPIHISAQQYLIKFYTELGFQISTAPYDEDGIPHIGMIYDGASVVSAKNP